VAVSDKRKKQAAKRTARQDAKRKQRQARVQRDSEGRTHLVVHRDELGRTMGLTLSEPLFHDQWQNDVAAAAANTTHGLMSAGQTRENAVKLGLNAMEATSKLTGGLLTLAPDRAPACTLGCAHCCYQAVGVAAPEVFAIYDHLRKARTEEELDATVRRIRDADDRTRGMTSDERLSPNLPCPFLENERCSIYEVRPLACRGKNSLDADACEKSLKDPEARAEFLAGRFPVPCYLEPFRAFHAVAAGMELALHEIHGLEVAPLELTAAMRILVDDPETVPEAWLRGENPFEAARGGDATNDPNIGELTGRRARAPLPRGESPR
jgi:Fe-S-cluster containining protein